MAVITCWAFRPSVPSFLHRRPQGKIAIFLVPHLIPGGVSHLQYADDTLLLFESDDHSVASIKLILLAFEILSGLKINFHKSEVITMGMDDQQSARVANLLNCKLGSFPIKYLGLPVSHRKLSILEWEPLYGKVANKDWIQEMN